MHSHLLQYLINRHLHQNLFSFDVSYSEIAIRDPDRPSVSSQATHSLSTHTSHIAPTGSKIMLQSRVALVSPIVIPASQDFDGNDGPWSSFTLLIGTPPQDVKVLISRAGYQTLPGLPQGCISSDPSNCATIRGGLYNPNLSTTWVKNNATANSTLTLNLENDLGYSDNGLYGYDTVQRGWQGAGGPSLKHQIIGGIATKDFFLGYFGVNPRPTNFTGTGFNDPIPSYLANLREINMIPSLSWSYTAGNQYSPGPTLGSLTLGGYDKSRFISNNATFAFDSVDLRDLSVSVSSISMTSNQGRSILSNDSVSAFIDSTLPYFFLPVSVCKAFENAFGIQWDNEVQAYLVNDTMHTALQAQNATVTFSLEGSVSGNQIVNITLPYAAFDLTASYPLLMNASRYFPLMRATNQTQYTLGRAFLQEAYVIADYDRRNFSVSQCSWKTGTPQDIVAIEPPKDAGSKSPNHLPAATLAAIILGAAVVIGLVALAVLFKVKKKKARSGVSFVVEKAELVANEKCGQKILASRTHEIDGEVYLGTEIDGARLPGYEIDSQEQYGEELENCMFAVCVVRMAG